MGGRDPATASVTRRAQRRDANRGYFAVGIAGGKTPENLGTLWRSAALYAAAFVFTVGKRYPGQSSDTTMTRKHTPLFHYANLADLVAHLPWSCPLIGVELAPDAIPLAGYSHPTRGCYLLGAEDRGLSQSQLACHQVVQIETARPWSMNVAVAGSLVLHDRHVKAQRYVLTEAAG